ncbi:MAG TPA: hypothetical protein VEA69_05975, partial [Tepidisphaeraceae bacterium]|nr:hypothetical protein [Tepidisphaeraceae bacterium]
NDLVILANNYGRSLQPAAGGPALDSAPAASPADQPDSDEEAEPLNPAPAEDGSIDTGDVDGATSAGDPSELETHASAPAPTAGTQAPAEAPDPETVPQPEPETVPEPVPQPEPAPEPVVSPPAAPRIAVPDRPAPHAPASAPVPAAIAAPAPVAPAGDPAPATPAPPDVAAPPATIAPSTPDAPPTPPVADARPQPTAFRSGPAIRYLRRGPAAAPAVPRSTPHDQSTGTERANPAPVASRPAFRPTLSSDDDAERKRPKPPAVFADSPVVAPARTQRGGPRGR